MASWVSMSTYRFRVSGYLWVSWLFMGIYCGLWVSACLWVLMGGMGMGIIFNIENISYFIIQEPQKI